MIPSESDRSKSFHSSRHTAAFSLSMVHVGGGSAIIFGGSHWDADGSFSTETWRYDAARELRLHAFVFTAGFTFPAAPYL